MSRYTFKRFKLSDIFQHYIDNVAATLPFRDSVINERSHAFVVAEDINMALISFKSVYDRLHDKYEPLFDLYDNELTNILNLSHKSVGLSTDETLQMITDAASEDTSLHKFNETPDGGNIDLTLDTYITSSDRVNINTGEKVRINDNERTLHDSRTDTDGIRQLEAITNINNKIADLEGLFLRDLDKEVLVFNYN